MALKDCATSLGADIMNNCNEEYGKGIEGVFYVISRKIIDWKASTREGHLITNIITNGKSGERGYKINYPSTQTPQITSTDTNPAIGTAFDKVLPVVLLADSPANAKAVMGLKQDKYIVIYENTVKGTNGDQAFPVIGWETGAVGRDLTLDKSSDDSLGGWAGNLTETGAPTSQLFFFKSDYEQTKEALESLCSVAADPAS